MYAIFTILHHDSTYDFSWISSTHTIDPAATSPAYTASDTSHSTCCLVGVTYLDIARRDHLQQQILAAAQRLSFGAETSTSEPSALLRGLGQLLFTQLIPETIQQQLAGLPPGSALQLVTDDLNWPWELLHDGKDFLALKHNVTRLPCLEKAQPQRTQHARTDMKPAKIACLLLGNPTGDLPGTEEEITAIEDTLFVAKERVTYRSLFGAHITADYLQDQFTTERYDLIHYAGHATSNSLTLANAPFRVDRLQAALPHHPVVVLNACATAQASTVAVDLSTLSRNAQSLAGAFIQSGAGAVIGMLWPISDAAAARFGEVLYQHLIAGEPIGTALRLSRIDLRRQDPQGIAWLAPVLYGNSLQQPIPAALKLAAGTVLAVRFPPSLIPSRGSKQPDASAVAQTLTRLAQRIAQYGGTIFHITESGLLATFGLDKLNDNSALTAIFAARDLTAQLGTWKVAPPAIAIVSGDLATGSLAQASSADTSTAPLLLGAAVQEAEQLVALATSGQVLINEPVRARAENHFHAQPWQESTLESAHDTAHLRAFELLSTPLRVMPGSLALDFSVTVGRKAEQTQLQTIWQRVQCGYGQVIGISGEAGIGKTHLLQTFRRQFVRDGAHWLQVGCTIDVQNTTYGLLARLFRSLLDLPHPIADAQLQQVIQMRFAGRATTDIALVTDLLGMNQQNAQRQERSVYQHQLARLLNHLVIGNIAERPLVLVVEDAHWSDAASLEVLTLLANHLEDVPILFCLVYRPEWQPPWIGKAYFQSIQLQALNHAERQQLYKELLDTTQLPDELIALIDRSSGNPLFLTEILMTLLHKGLLVPAAGSDKVWQTVGMLLARDLPDSVHRVIDLRLEQLAEPTREVLAVAAVLGARFTPNMLPWGVTLPQEELYAQLALLTEQDLLRGSLVSEEYTFRHELIRDVVYMKIPLPQRQLWHRQVAEALEEQGAARREVVALLAHHYYHSLIDEEDAVAEIRMNRTSDVSFVEKAIMYLVQSGEDALDRYGGLEALTLFQRAHAVLQLLPANSSFRAKVHRGMGDAYRLSNNFAAASESYAEAHATLHRRPLTTDVRPQVAELTRLLARLYMWKADYPTAEAWIASGLVQVANQMSSQCQTGAAMLHIQMGSIRFNQGNYVEAVHHCETGLTIANDCRNEEAIAEGNHVLGAALRKLGRYAATLACYEKSLAIHQRQKNLYQFHRVQMNIGIVYFHLSQWKRAVAYYDEVIAFFREINDKTMLASMYINIGLAQQYMGNWATAEANFQQALLLSCEIQNQTLIALSHCNLGTLYVLQESWQYAQDHLTESLATLESRQIKAYTADIKAHQALTSMAMEDWDRAHALVGEAIAFATEQGEQQYLAVALRSQGRIFLAQSNLEQALPCFEKSIALFDELGSRYERERTTYWLAATYQQLGDWMQAENLYTQAMRIFEELGARQDLLMAETAREQLRVKM